MNIDKQAMCSNTYMASVLAAHLATHQRAQIHLCGYTGLVGGGSRCTCNDTVTKSHGSAS
jgi:hypothetical protein